VIGHNPLVQATALALATSGDAALRQRLAAKYPTGALVEIAFEIDHWRDAGPGNGRLKHFIRPRDLGDGLGPND
jgi:phosphohistidine phosphatase